MMLKTLKKILITTLQTLFEEWMNSLRSEFQVIYFMISEHPRLRQSIV